MLFNSDPSTQLKLLFLPESKKNAFGNNFNSEC